MWLSVVLLAVYVCDCSCNTVGGNTVCEHSSSLYLHLSQCRMDHCCSDGVAGWPGWPHCLLPPEILLGRYSLCGCNNRVRMCVHMLGGGGEERGRLMLSAEIFT